MSSLATTPTASATPTNAPLQAQMARPLVTVFRVSASFLNL
jgi:hypothetical protein